LSKKLKNENMGRSLSNNLDALVSHTIKMVKDVNSDLQDQMKNPYFKLLYHVLSLGPKQTQ
jgi:hypothetical protein